ncbi:MAG: ankyrin repeat domain-containing protein [Pseudomonadota bacterium]
MAFAELPDNPSLDHLKKQAKRLLRSAREGDEAALGRIGPYFGHPRSIGLQSAQLVIAREYGFSSWARLKGAVERPALARRNTPDQLANRFLDLVCLTYRPDVDAGPHRFKDAGALLAAHPEIAEESIYTAAALGDVERIDHWLASDEGLINRKGGYFNWEPIMYAAYARLPGSTSLAGGLRLLKRGADPNAHYMWGGQYRFTALTGVFGQGEGGPVNFPEHPDCVAFARGLLEAGAEPNDSQAAYNRCFEKDDTCLELLLEYGLSPRDRNNWLLEDGDRLVPNSSQTMHFHLIQALHRGFDARAKLLIDHGVDVDKPDDTYDTLTKGKTPYEAARLLGQDEIADYLLAHGATQAELSNLEQFQAACMSGDTQKAMALRTADPTLTHEGRPLEREMLGDAVVQGNRPALAAMIELGFDLGAAGTQTPLHDAAFHGREDMARMLLEAGADPTVREPNHAAPPIGFAQYAGQDALVALLDGERMDIFTAAARGNLDELRRHLSADADRHKLRFSEVRPKGCGPMESDWMTPLAYAVLNRQVDAICFLLQHGADAGVASPTGKTILDLAEEGGDQDVLAALARKTGAGS